MLDELDYPSELSEPREWFDDPFVLVEDDEDDDPFRNLLPPPGLSDWHDEPDPDVGQCETCFRDEVSLYEWGVQLICDDCYSRGQDGSELG